MPQTQKNPHSLHRTNILYSEVLKDSMIVDRSDPDGSVPPSNWRLVAYAFVNVFFKVMEENPGPVYQMCGWHQGNWKLIMRADTRPLYLFSIAIARIGEIWKGVKLEVVPNNAIPSVGINVL